MKNCVYNFVAQLFMMFDHTLLDTSVFIMLNPLRNLTVLAVCCSKILM